ncbi:MAG: 3-hydroxyacyl-[acyl-carrier-protein] dehydratase [Thermotogaceae bacterium]|nr:3-hydroxyacyl-[acyl-carrier-protein] dehydratase [Thermotogaceae bacterium]MDN5337307.1 3-hydroxyacyl-[acyl-carrier-protein] dehydratase [Thermotogaceae bacterium]
MNIDDIMKVLPHRYPFLLVDKVIQMDAQKIVALKNVSINEPYFQGHFPEYPIFPGVLQIEGIAQCAGILLMHDLSEKVIPLFLGIEKARFKREVRPGDQMIYEVTLQQSKGNVYKLHGLVKVNEKICTQAEILVGFKKG